MAQIGKRAWKRRFWQLSLAILLLVIILAVGGGIVYYMTSRPPGLSQKDLCPADGPSGHFVLLVDKTDPLSFTQKQAFLVTLQELIEQRIPKGYLLSVFVLGEDFKDTAEPLVELCNPGTGSDKSEFTANLKKLRRQYEDKFLKPIRSLSDDLIAVQPAKTSPIFEMLQLVGINAFRKRSVTGERRLIIISDMLHNTLQLSMYNGLPDLASLVKSDYGRKTQPDLQGVKVELHCLINTPYLQNMGYVKFWEDYFKNAGARLVDVKSLGG